MFSFFVVPAERFFGFLSFPHLAEGLTINLELISISSTADENFSLVNYKTVLEGTLKTRRHSNFLVLTVVLRI